jgi:hypothetical protein
VRKFFIHFMVLAAAGFFAADAFARENFSDYLAGSGSLSHLNLLAGTKTLSASDWEPAQDALALGLEWDYTEEDWPVGMTWGLFYAKGEGKGSTFGGASRGIGGQAAASSSGSSFSSRTIELMFGFKKIWVFDSLGWFRPHLGGGVSLGQARAKFPGGSEEGYGMGGWGAAGFAVDAWGPCQVGLDFRYSSVAAKFDRNSVDAGGIYLLGFIGYGL